MMLNTAMWVKWTFSSSVSFVADKRHGWMIASKIKSFTRNYFSMHMNSLANRLTIYLFLFIIIITKIVVYIELGAFSRTSTITRNQCLWRNNRPHMNMKKKNRFFSFQAQIMLVVVEIWMQSSRTHNRRRHRIDPTTYVYVSNAEIALL